ncbi:MAG: toprim domain-containing protein [Oscillospiraceae bacterium]
MAKTLVLAEKPSVGKEIARVLGCKRSGNGFLESDRYIVTWALGHLVELEDPEYYGSQYKTWSMETLPMLPQKMALKVIPETSKQYSVVKKLLHRQDVGSLVIATDAGREGELVARWIGKGGVRGRSTALISSQTDKAIRQGFASLKGGRDYLGLYRSAQSRARRTGWSAQRHARPACTTRSRRARANANACADRPA